jgi:hypothetical protein
MLADESGDELEGTESFNIHKFSVTFGQQHCPIRTSK